MKKLLAASLIVTALFLSGCPKVITPEKVVKEVQTDSDETTKVCLLFEHDNVKVYRFADCGRYVYYTNTVGNCQWEVREGKHSSVQNSINTVSIKSKEDILKEKLEDLKKEYEQKAAALTAGK